MCLHKYMAGELKIQDDKDPPADGGAGFPDRKAVLMIFSGLRSMSPSAGRCSWNMMSMRSSQLWPSTFSASIPWFSSTTWITLTAYPRRERVPSSGGYTHQWCLHYHGPHGLGQRDQHPLHKDPWQYEDPMLQGQAHKHIIQSSKDPCTSFMH